MSSWFRHVPLRLTQIAGHHAVGIQHAILPPPTTPISDIVNAASFSGLLPTSDTLLSTSSASFRTKSSAKPLYRCWASSGPHLHLSSHLPLPCKHKLSRVDVAVVVISHYVKHLLSSRRPHSTWAARRLGNTGVVAVSSQLSTSSMKPRHVRQVCSICWEGESDPGTLGPTIFR